MASASYTFTHASNAVFTTQIDLQDAATGVVNYQVYFKRSSTSWTSYNLFVPPNNAPYFSFALGAAGFSGYYTYDFRTGGSGNMSKLIGSGSISVPSGSTLSLSGSNDPKGSMGAASASGTFTTAAAPTPAPSFSTQNAPTPVIRGVAYTGQFTASNTSSYAQTGTLPPGLSFNTSSGALTGTPNTVGSYGFTITANGPGGSANVSKTVVVNPPTPVFSDSSVLNSINLSTAYSDGVAASDTTTYSVFSGALPTSLSLNTSTGAITGTPTVAGVFIFVIRATNVTGSADTGALTITVGGSRPKVWDGTAFVPGTIKVWNSTAFVSGTIKVWNGTTFVPIT
jgi:hypothetical protein